MIVTLIRTAILYVFVMIGLRIMGKRQIGDMQPNELVTTILVSEIATVPIQDIDQPVLNGAVAILLLVLMEVVMSVLALKSGFVRCAVNGRPVVIIRHGKVDQAALKKLRMTVDDLTESLRQQQVFNVKDVDFAIVETNGSVSVMLNPEKQPFTVGDSDAQIDKSGFPVPVVCDGKIQPHFMESMKVTEHQVNEALNSRGMDIKEVFLMTVDAQGTATVIKKEAGR